MTHAVADHREIKEGACIQVDIPVDHRPSRLECSREHNYNYMAAPEKEVTMCAIQLAVLEKAASGLGALGFVWATVVLLGGFAITLQWKDFGFVSVTLLIEGTRIFSRSHELELRRQATWSLTEASQSSFHAIRSRFRHLVESLKFIFAPFSANNAKIANDVNSSSTRAHEQCCTLAPERASSVWHSHNMQQLPVPIRFISGLFYWLQLVSATTCVVLSTMRLASQDFGNSEEAEKSNRNFALNVFYAMALAEALVFLAEKAFWEWKVNYCGLLEKVSAECQLGLSGMVSIKRFFYDTYSKCVTGSIFDGLKMDLVTFAEELLVSSSGGEELMGVRILLALSTHQHLSDAAIRKVGTSTVVIERLIEMLNWKSPSEEEIRYSAAVIVSKLASKEQNASRVAEIPGAMESISSLLYSSAKLTQCQMHDLSTFNLPGLLILKKLAKKHDTCAKMGDTHGLLDKIIDFTSIANSMINNVKAVKRSLQVVTMLASTTGHTGVMLRQEISENMFFTSNIRDILHHGGHHLGLQRLALELLEKLAMDGDAAQERIGRTGGMVKELLGLFFQPGKTHERQMVRVEAGEALAVLVIENKANCGRVLKHERTVERLTEALGDPLLYVTSSRILQSLCAFAGPEWNRELSRSVDVAGLRRVLINGVMEEEEDVKSNITIKSENGSSREELMEASLGLAAQMLKFTSPAKLSKELCRAGLSEADLVTKLVGILGAYKEEWVKAPEMRRHAVEVAVELMRMNKKKYGMMFREGGMAREVRRVAETTSEVERCNMRLRFRQQQQQQLMSLDLLLHKALQLMH